jgi:hypothetical protein
MLPHTHPDRLPQNPGLGRLEVRSHNHVSTLEPDCTPASKFSAADKEYGRPAAFLTGRLSKPIEDIAERRCLIECAECRCDTRCPSKSRAHPDEFSRCSVSFLL